MNTLRLIAILLLIFNATGALFGGWSLIQDPTGSDLKLPLTYLEHSPFKDFFIPGLILFIVNGVFSVITIFWTGLQRRQYPWLIIIQGGILTSWIIAQMIMIREINYLHFIYGGLGLSLLWIGFALKNKSL